MVTLVSCSPKFVRLFRFEIYSNLFLGAAGGRPALSPYDNVSITQSLDSYSLDLDFSSNTTSRFGSNAFARLARIIAPSWAFVCKEYQ